VQHSLNVLSDDGSEVGLCASIPLSAVANLHLALA